MSPTLTHEGVPARLPYGGVPKVARKRQARRCSAHRTDGQPCGSYAINGGDVCAAHGGRAPQAKRAAAGRVAETGASTVCARLGLRVATSAGRALQEELERATGAVAYYEAKLAELAEDDLIWGTTKRVVKPGAAPTNQRGGQQGQPTMEVTQGAVPHVYLTLWAAERQRVADVAAAMARLGLEERSAAAQEELAGYTRKIITMISAACVTAGLTREQQQEVHVAFGRQVVALLPERPPLRIGG